ncbi:hypothetical protein BCU70_19200 [Vibrio sp. 10N.286.49.C2]|uniref:DUF2164 domain-containing protein n=1 Tax=unclassified Vibrio TaxID=2614977 RepID=UPI000C84206B|nr:MULTISPECIES: DUF2164 domain-containing protein [unclassified Vibrio]PMH34792.1 hypothetical protein BCU70_19200 [Vibrio sp. 10N.286.49.C2]PMH51420.1 hypothetical protein BCU66_16915 [Vibrio sp. 10N.286.49.B1]PMH81827.1 hypothetical protein BCU58_20405 [Vibrio sp. 10N.286.48.B7]
MFEKQQREQIIRDLQHYFSDELEHELEQFDAEFLLDFIVKKMGPAFYNKGLEDAKQVFERRVLDITDELYEIEMPVD